MLWSVEVNGSNFYPVRFLRAFYYYQTEVCFPPWTQQVFWMEGMDLAMSCLFCFPPYSVYLAPPSNNPLSIEPPPPPVIYYNNTMDIILIYCFKHGFCLMLTPYILWKIILDFMDN